MRTFTSIPHYIAKQNPCRYCEKRHPCCHNECKEYMVYRVLLDDFRHRKQSIDKAEREQIDVEIRAKRLRQRRRT